MKLCAIHLTIDRGEHRLIHGLSFELLGGEALLVTGRNGAGKSTLLRTIAGLHPLSKGQLSLQIEDRDSEVCSLAENSHYVGHVDGLKSALTARENLSFWAAMLTSADAQMAAPALSPEEALFRLGLNRIADFPVAYLSAGQARRVALARLLVARRVLWLLDEPATSLDAASQELLAKVMAAHLAKGGLIVAATHSRLGLSGARELPLGEAAEKVAV